MPEMQQKPLTCVAGMFTKQVAGPGYALSLFMAGEVLMLIEQTMVIPMTAAISPKRKVEEYPNLSAKRMKLA